MIHCNWLGPAPRDDRSAGTATFSVDWSSMVVNPAARQSARVPVRRVVLLTVTSRP
jgi:hypothetical protein